uniref:Tr-type G domain-containing protein n=1 Tax=Corethron hystrix TaxID=216773 RepID=A0A7S1BW46_9STRA
MPSSSYSRLLLRASGSERRRRRRHRYPALAAGFLPHPSLLLRSRSTISSSHLLHPTLTPPLPSLRLPSRLFPLLSNMGRAYPLSSSLPSAEESSPALAFALSPRSDVRNVAIVAHVDHGKTTLVDRLLQAASSDQEIEVSAPSAERLMDTGELEVERGITITSKVTRVDFRRRGGSRTTTVNIIDTPGHADFAGEVDRILSSVDGIVLVVDTAEGPMAQTKYVLGRSLKMGLRPIVVLNKCDRTECLRRLENGDAELEVMALFENLGATEEEQTDYPTVYVSARGGWATEDLDAALGVATGEREPDENMEMELLLGTILDHLPPPSVRSYHDVEDGCPQPFSMTATTVGYDPYLGRTVTGRIHSGSVSENDAISLLRRGTSSDDPSLAASSNVSGIFVNRGVSRTPLDPPYAEAGDIVTLAGVPHAVAVGDTLTSTSNLIDEAIDTPPPAPPTLSMDFGANDGPLAGREGTIVASSKVRERLLAETDNNVTLQAVPSTTDAERTTVFGRGELQLGVLVEQMRREGFELLVAPPRVVRDICLHTGYETEPFEEATVDVDAEFAGSVIDLMTGPARRAAMTEMHDSADGKTRLVFEGPSRGLLGLGPEMAAITRGSAVLHHAYVEHRKCAPSTVNENRRGRLVSSDAGAATAYALDLVSARGTLFIRPGDAVYGGMVIGEGSRTGDLEVNPVRGKQLTNMRTQSKEERVVLSPPREFTVEEYMGYMRDDEVLEVTPKSVRLRKKLLDAGERARATRAKKQAQKAGQEKNSGKKKR